MFGVLWQFELLFLWVSVSPVLVGFSGHAPFGGGQCEGLGFRVQDLESLISNLGLRILSGMKLLTLQSDS